MRKVVFCGELLVETHFFGGLQTASSVLEMLVPEKAKIVGGAIAGFGTLEAYLG